MEKFGGDRKVETDPVRMSHRNPLSKYGSMGDTLFKLCPRSTRCIAASSPVLHMAEVRAPPKARSIDPLKYGKLPRKDVSSEGRGKIRASGFFSFDQRGNRLLSPHQSHDIWSWRPSGTMSKYHFTRAVRAPAFKARTKGRR